MSQQTNDSKNSISLPINSLSDKNTKQSDLSLDYKQKITIRMLKALNYLSIYVFVLFVYGGAVLTDYLLFEFMWMLLGKEIEKYAIVSLALDYAKTGLALLFIVSAIFHGMISTYSQIKLDLHIMKED